MTIKLLTSFLLLIMATPETFAQDRNRRGNNRGSETRRGDANRGSTTRTAPRDRGRRADRRRPTRTREDRTTRNTRRDSRRDRGTVDRNRNRGNRGTVDRNRNRGNRRAIDRRRARANRSYSRHRPADYRHRSYTRSFHRPYSRTIRSHRRFARNGGYYSFMRRNHRNHIYLNWILSPSSRYNGYYYSTNNSYPYFVHNGYRHRYSNLETCNYQLVDKYNHRVERTYYGQTCSRGYNACAYDRDINNDREYSNRYFCAETFRDTSYNFSVPSYDTQSYSSQDYYND